MPQLWLSKQVQRLIRKDSQVASELSDSYAASEQADPTDLEAQAHSSDQAEALTDQPTDEGGLPSGRKSLFSKISNAKSLQSFKVRVEDTLADSRVAGSIFQAGQHLRSSVNRLGGHGRRRIMFRNNMNTNRHLLLSKIKDPEERSRVARLRGKMKVAIVQGKRKHDGESARDIVDDAKRHITTKEEDERHHLDEVPEEGELVDIIQELMLTVEPAVEMLGETFVLDQRRAGTLNVRDDKTIQRFKKHKAVMGKQLFEAENANNMACEQFYLGDIDAALIYFQRALEVASVERRRAAEEVEDLRKFVASKYGGDAGLFYTALSEGEWRSGLGRRKFTESARKMNYPGDPERLFEIFDSIARDGKIALEEISHILKTKSQRLEVMDYDIIEKGIILNNIAACNLLKGDGIGALSNLREAMNIVLLNVDKGNEDHRAQRIMGNMAVAYISLEDFDQALELLSQLQDLRETRWGASHPEVLTVLYHIGYSFLAKASRFKIIYDVQRKDGRAQEKPIDFNFNLSLCAFKERLQRQETLLEEKRAELEKQATEDPDTGDVDQLRLDIARSMEIIGEIHEKIGQPDRALPFFRQAAHLREEILADTDPELLSAWNMLASICLKTGCLEEALATMERATRASQMLFGEVSATVATMLYHTGVVMFKLGATESVDGKADQAAERFALALDKLTKARDMQMVVSGEDGVDVAATNQLIGNVFLAQGNQREARKKFEESLLKRLTSLGRSAVATASSAHALGALYARMPRRREEAIQLLRKASLVREKRLGDHSLHLADSLHELGCALLRRDTFEDAEAALAYLSRAAQIREKLLDKHSATFAASLHQVGQAHLRVGYHHEARLYLQAAVEIRERLMGRKTAQVAASHFGLAMAFYHLVNFRKSIKHYKVSYSIRERLFGMEHHLSADSLHEIGVVYVRKKELEAALPFLKRAMEIRMALNQKDAADLQEDSSEDDKYVFRPDSHRQIRIKEKRDQKKREAARLARKKAREEEKMRKFREREKAKVALARQKRRAARQKQKEAEDKRQQGGTRLTRTFGKMLSRVRTKTIKEAGDEEKGETGEDEEDGSDGEDEDEEDEEDEKEEEDGEREKEEGEEGEAVNETTTAHKDADERSDSEVDISELGIDVRGWLSGSIGDDMFIISNVYMDLKEYAQAKYYLDRAICLREEVYGESSPEYAEALHGYGFFHVTKNHLFKSINYFMKALGIRERVRGHYHEDTATTEIALGEALANLGQPDEALIHLMRGCSIRDRLFGFDDPVTKQLREKWQGLSAGATFYDPVPEGESVPHFARRSPESFLHGFAEKQTGKLTKTQLAIGDGESVVSPTIAGSEVGSRATSARSASAPEALGAIEEKTEKRSEGSASARSKKDDEVSRASEGSSGQKTKSPKGSKEAFDQSQQSIKASKESSPLSPKGSKDVSQLSSKSPKGSVISESSASAKGSRGSRTPRDKGAT